MNVWRIKKPGIYTIPENFNSNISIESSFVELNGNGKILSGWIHIGKENKSINSICVTNLIVDENGQSLKCNSLCPLCKIETPCLTNRMIAVKNIKIQSFHGIKIPRIVLHNVIAFELSNVEFMF